MSKLSRESYLNDLRRRYPHGPQFQQSGIVKRYIANHNWARVDAGRKGGKVTAGRHPELMLNLPQYQNPAALVALLEQHPTLIPAAIRNERTRRVLSENFPRWIEQMQRQNRTAHKVLEIF